ncbi:hypothetical protein ACFRKC_43180, partial [Streptomyces chartreusis]
PMAYEERYQASQTQEIPVVRIPQPQQPYGHPAGAYTGAPVPGADQYGGARTQAPEPQAQGWFQTPDRRMPGRPQLPQGPGHSGYGPEQSYGTGQAPQPYPDEHHDRRRRPPAGDGGQAPRA